MQLRYLGDVTDHAKYALLRRLIGEHDRGRRLRLGINWYLTDPAVVDAPENNDGHKRDLAPDLVALDPDLAQHLAGLREPTARSFDRLRATGIFPDDTTYHEEPVPLPDRLLDRQPARAAWHGRALHALVSADVIFLDPDNGLNMGAAGAQSSSAPKYAYGHEIQSYLASGRSLVLIHFYDLRLRPADAVSQLVSSLGALGAIAVHFRRVVFLIIPNGQHAAALGRRVDALAGTAFNRVL